MAQKNSKSAASSTPKKRWKFEFGPFGLLGIGLVGILIMAWAFILGILVGRGYNPESVIPEIGRIIAPQTPLISTAPPRTVLKPEELRFHDTLQERGHQPAPSTPGRSGVVNTQQPQPPPPPQRIQPQVEQAAPRPQAPPEAPPTSAAPLGPQFEFTFQVASFQHDNQARRLQQRITTSGISATTEAGMVNGRQWYRVLVTVQGSQTDADRVKTQLQGLGIEAPFLRAKKSL